MTILAALATQHNAAEHQPKAKNDRNEIAKPSEGRSGIRRRRQDGVDDAGFAPRKRLHDIAAGIDDRADSGWRGAQNGQTLLSRAEAGLGEVLRRPPAAEPRVVGWVEDEGRPV